MWSADDARLVYTKVPDLFIRDANGTGEERRLLQARDNQHATDWSLDGRLFCITQLAPQPNETSGFCRCSRRGTGRRWPKSLPADPVQ